MRSASEAGHYLGERPWQAQGGGRAMLEKRKMRGTAEVRIEGVRCVSRQEDSPEGGGAQRGEARSVLFFLSFF